MKNNNWQEIISRFSLVDKGLLLVALIGVVIFVTSLFRGITKSSQVQVEFVKGVEVTKEEVSSVLMVDVSGSVINPGVYELPTNSRIKDVLTKAGGLSADADREYVQTSVNLAEKVVDGQKIYFPKVGATPSGVGYSEAKTGSKKININTASVIELDTLVGIGAARAADIVGGRPYRSVDDLVTKKVLTKGVLDKIRGEIVAY